MVPDEPAANDANQRVLKTAKSFNVRKERGRDAYGVDRDTFGNRETDARDRDGADRNGLARSQTEDPRRDTR